MTRCEEGGISDAIQPTTSFRVLFFVLSSFREVAAKLGVLFIPREPPENPYGVWESHRGGFWESGMGFQEMTAVTKVQVWVRGKYR